MLRRHLFLIPYAAPSTVVFVGNGPQGVRQGCRTLPKGQESLLATPDKNDGAQETSGIGSPFLWILSFGEAKESISPSGARTRLNQSVAVATQIINQQVRMWMCVT
jgi:hypothetical protein